MNKSDASGQKKFVYREFGSDGDPEVFARSVPNLPPEKQSLIIQATRSGRKGKTVTLITGFQVSEDVLLVLLKQLKTQCGSGGTVKENTLEIQGEHKEKISQILKQLGYKVKISGG